MTGTDVDTVEALENVVGATPAAMHLKVIDHLDTGALKWIADTPLIMAAFGGPAGAGIQVTLAGDAPGFATGDALELRLPLRAIDDAEGARPGAAFGALCLIPGIGETLRINGRVSSTDDDHIRIAVEECYGHCAKALIRSGLWTAQPTIAPDDAGGFIAASSFVALGSINAAGRADVSPKGDPAGCMAHIDGDILWFADRPGNRRMDSFRNILECPTIALTLMIPGTSRIAQVRGHARLSTDTAPRERFAVQGKVPLLAVGVNLDALTLRDSAALARANLWPVGAVSDINPAKLFVDHIKLNKNGGIGAALTRASLSVPGMNGLMKKGLEKDYRDNLY